MSENPEPYEGSEIAIIAMAGRFPGARDPEALWRNLEAGVESISRPTPEAALAAGADPEFVHHPHYVNAKGILEGTADFDAAYFGFTPKEARYMDPQLRLLLEHAVEALERAGYDPQRYDGLVGVFVGGIFSSYLLNNVLPAGLGGLSVLQLHFGNDRDYLATSVSYRLNLKGPSFTVQTACSTSLVAVHLACQSLLQEECDLALAGGVTISVPEPLGYHWQQDGIVSPDGHCRPFDAEAAGTVFSDGVGLVVLKRLACAVADGDPVLAVIRGSAINNDGAAKVGYSAPGIEGQSGVIIEALAAAEAEPSTISYVEAHGTGTHLGDPIEIAALARAFRGGDACRACAIGSIKSNLGHLRMAAGIAGLIKVVQMIRHRRIPPTLHYRQPNPELELDATPFRVVSSSEPWETDGRPLRAGVSAFGMGGTNAHVVVEEAPPPAPTDAGRAWQLLVLSAKTATALETATRELATHLDEHPDSDLADVAYTLQVGRQLLSHRRMLVADTPATAAAALTAGDPRRVGSEHARRQDRPVVFLFPGQGVQSPGMGLDLYRREPVFRNEIDACCETLAPHLGSDLRSLLYPESERREEARRRLTQTAITQPAVFVTCLALARLWMSWGIRPAAMLGHSLGEYVAACLAGVFSRRDALELVAERGRLFQSLPPGAMLAVRCGCDEIEPQLDRELALAAVNGPASVVVSGPAEAVDALATRLAAEGVGTRRLETSHAFHSPMVEPILEPFRRKVAALAARAPQIPFVSNLTGDWITAAAARDPDYWVEHLRRPVRFADGVATLLGEEANVLLEVGPGRTLSTLARRCSGGKATVFASLAERVEAGEASASELRQLVTALGRLWLTGVSVDWRMFHAGMRRRRVLLPSYPFERQRYWIEPVAPLRHGLLGNLASVEAASAADEPRRGALRSGFIAPRDELERAVAAIWEQELGMAQVGIDDDYFELGGDSLLAVQLTARLREELGLEVSVRTLFERPTIAELRAAAESTGPRPDLVRETIPALPRAAAGSLPFSPAQESMAFIHRLDPDNPINNLSLAFLVRGELDPVALAHGVDDLVARHEALRTVFAYRDDQLRAHTAGSKPQLTVVDLRAHGDEGCRQVLARVLEEAAQRPFDLARGPLLRVLLVRLAENRQALGCVVHHIVSDFFSLRILLRDLLAGYAGRVRGEAPALPSLPIQYADFAAWEEQASAGETRRRQLAYWQRQLAGAPPVIELALDRPRPATQSFRGAHVLFTLPAALTAAVHGLAQLEKVSLFMTLLAGLDLLLQHYSGCDDVVVGVPFARRELPQTRDLVGPFFNPVVLRVDLAGDPSFHELVDRVRTAVTAAHAHQDLPFQKLVELLAPERDPRYNPLFQVMFTFLEQVEVGADAELALEPLPVETGHAAFDLFLVMHERGGQLEGAFGYNTDLFDAATIEAMVAHFETLLAAAVRRPQASLGELRSDLPIQKLELVVAATFTAEPLAEPLEFLLAELTVPAVVRFAPYGQVFQQLLDPESRLGRNRSGWNVLLLRLEDWGGDDPGAMRRRIEDNVESFLTALAAVRQRARIRGWICLAPPSDKIAGDPAMARFLSGQESRIAAGLRTLPGFSLLDAGQVRDRFRVDRITDPHADDLAHIPYTEVWFAALAGAIARRLSSELVPAPRALVLDAADALRAAGDGLEETSRLLQGFARERLRAGVRVGLLDRGDPNRVAELLARVPDMPLSPDQLAARAGDASPGTALRTLAHQLRVELDELVFLSSEPEACAAVRSECPQVLALRMPRESAELPRFLDHLWIFDGGLAEGPTIT